MTKCIKNIDEQIKGVHEILVFSRAKILYSGGDFSSLKRFGMLFFMTAPLNVAVFSPELLFCTKGSSANYFTPLLSPLAAFTDWLSSMVH